MGVLRLASREVPTALPPKFPLVPLSKAKYSSSWIVILTQDVISNFSYI